ncbi:MAG TPA: hypothetical protein VF813_04250, partial [Anaerolineaceae bacterium]
MRAFLSNTGSGIARAVQSPDGRWSVENVLQGQAVTCLAADPLQAGVVYAGTRGRGVLCSSDYGRTWSPLGLDGLTVKAVSASRITPGVIYAGTKPAFLFASRDHGQSWEELTAFRKIISRFMWLQPAESPHWGYVQGIALSSTNPDVILAGIEAGAVVRSTDGGKTWQDHRRGALRDCHSISFHPTQGDWAYEAGGTGAGVAFSQDGGNSWLQPRTGLDRHYGWACAADSRNPEIWYASLSPSAFKAHSENNAQAYIFRSARDGAWQKLGGGLPQPLDAMPYALLVDPSEPGSVYAGLSSGDVWHSADAGDAWE